MLSRGDASSRRAVSRRGGRCRRDTARIRRTPLRRRVLSRRFVFSTTREGAVDGVDARDDARDDARYDAGVGGVGGVGAPSRGRGRARGPRASRARRRIARTRRPRASWWWRESRTRPRGRRGRRSPRGCLCGIAPNDARGTRPPPRRTSPGGRVGRRHRTLRTERVSRWVRAPRATRRVSEEASRARHLGPRGERTNRRTPRPSRTPPPAPTRRPPTRMWTRRRTSPRSSRRSDDRETTDPRIRDPSPTPWASTRRAQCQPRGCFVPVGTTDEGDVYASREAER